MSGEAMTLADYAATQKENYLLQGFVNAMMDDNSVGGMGVLGLLKWRNVDALTSVIPRMVDEGGPAPVSAPIGGTYNSGVVAPVHESVSVGNVGQDVIIPRAYMLKQGNYLNGLSPKEVQTQYLSKRIKRYINNKAVNGSKATDPNGFNGLKYFVDPNMIIDMGADVPNASSYSTSGCDLYKAFTATKGKDFLTALNWALDAVPGANAILTNYQMLQALLISIRDVGGNGFFKTTQDSYDRRVDSYRDVPFVVAGSKNAVKTLKEAISDTNAVIPNNYTYGNIATATEIYVVRFDADDGVCGTQYNPLDVRDVADEMTQGPAALIRADWYPGLYRWKEDAIAKIVGLKVV